MPCPAEEAGADEVEGVGAVGLGAGGAAGGAAVAAADHQMPVRLAIGGVPVQNLA